MCRIDRTQYRKKEIKKRDAFQNGLGWMERLSHSELVDSGSGSEDSLLKLYRDSSEVFELLKQGDFGEPNIVSVVH